MNYYAEPRMTRDIDLVVALEPGDTPRVRELFEPDYYVPPDVEQIIQSRRLFNMVHVKSVIKVDVIVRKDDDYRRVEFARRRPVELPGFRTWIVSKEDLILSKLRWARESASELQLRDVRNLLASGVDEEYLPAWAGRLGVSELLESCRHA